MRSRDCKITNLRNFFCQPCISCIFDHKLTEETPNSFATSTHPFAYIPVTSFVLSGSFIAFSPCGDLYIKKYHTNPRKHTLKLNLEVREVAVLNHLLVKRVNHLFENAYFTSRVIL
ncbi:hypothetical protein HanPI659440_Chr02g0038581 [Helianthus annuus]|nr:hypothetical protein HanPI659440_Chr02g0038581 [Helianthus annuus]